MNKIVGVQLRKGGKIYSFDSGHFVLEEGVKVLVETDLGPALGVVRVGPRDMSELPDNNSLKKISRFANEKDIERYEKGLKIEKEVYEFCYERIKSRELPMSLISTEHLLDGSKIMVYFSAEGRIDFRELVKDLVKKFHTRIEMRQVGVRHQAKMTGGLGGCGRQLCCTSFLNRFAPVSIKMAKEQNLSLNPTKISGMCGRLMCCLTYEHGYYENAKKNIPKPGKKVETIHGSGKVIRQNVLKKILTVMLESGEEKEIPFDEVIKKQNKPQPQKPEKKDRNSKDKKDRNNKGQKEKNNQGKKNRYNPDKKDKNNTEKKDRNNRDRKDRKNPDKKDRNNQAKKYRNNQDRNKTNNKEQKERNNPPQKGSGQPDK